MIRKSKYNINPLILERWSPRAMSGENITKKELMTIFEAGRFAPSAYNKQPWKFLYAFKDDFEWSLFFDTLVDFNKEWAKNSSVLVLIISDKFIFDRESNVNKFDAGAAWENMALQASSMGLVVHGMSGFDYNKIRNNLNIPEDYDIVIIFAIGKKGSINNLSKEFQEREKISKRKDLSEIVIKGKYK